MGAEIYGIGESERAREQEIGVGQLPCSSAFLLSCSNHPVNSPATLLDPDDGDHTMNSAFWGLSNMHAGVEAARAEASAAGARNQANQAIRTVNDLQEQLDKLTLINMAMWSMLQDVGRFKEEDLIRRVQDLDLMDGVPDGKITRQVARCPKCDRIMSPKHKKCLYCEYANLKSSAFDDVT